MDSRVAKWLLEAIRFGAVIVTVVVYLERRLGHLEMADALHEERAKAERERAAHHEARLDRLDASSAARLDVGADGGFGHPAIRGIINSTIREQTRDHVTRAELDRLRSEQLEYMRRIIEANSLKPAH